jgi:hypothetical protein
MFVRGLGLRVVAVCRWSPRGSGNSVDDGFLPADRHTLFAPLLVVDEPDAYFFSNNQPAHDR